MVNGRGSGALSKNVYDAIFIRNINALLPGKSNGQNKGEKCLKHYEYNRHIGVLK